MQGKGIDTKPLGSLLAKRHKKPLKELQKTYKKSKEIISLAKSSVPERSKIDNFEIEFEMLLGSSIFQSTRKNVKIAKIYFSFILFKEK